MNRNLFFIIAFSLSLTACQRYESEHRDPIIEDAQGNYLDLNCLRKNISDIQANGREEAVKCAVGSKSRGLIGVSSGTPSTSFNISHLFPPVASVNNNDMLTYHNYSCQSLFGSWWHSSSIQDSCYTSVFGYYPYQYGNPYSYSGYQSPFIRRWVQRLLKNYYVRYCQQNPYAYGCSVWNYVQKPTPWPSPAPAPSESCYDVVHNGQSICTQAIQYGYKVDRTSGSCVQTSAPNGCYKVPFSSLQDCQYALATDRCGFMAPSPQEDCTSQIQIGYDACTMLAVEGYHVIGNACVKQWSGGCYRPRFGTYAECEAKRATGRCMTIVY